MDDSQKMIATYVEQVLLLVQTRENHTIEPGELDQLARELGLSEADLDWIDQQFYAFLERGKGFATYQNWEKAIPELEQAVNLKPLHLEALGELASAYRGRWIKSRKSEDKTKAMLLAERCLQYDPSNQVALRVINFLDKNSSPRRSHRAKFPWLPGMFLALGFLALGLGLYTWWYTRPETSPQAQVPRPETKVVYHKEQTVPDGKSVSLRLSPEMEAKAYFLETHTVLVQEQKAKNTLWIRASLKNPVYAIQNLKVKLVLQSPQGQVLATVSRELWNEDQAPTWPGDRIPMHFTYALAAKNYPATGMRAQLMLEEQISQPLDTQDLVQQSFYLADPLGNLIQIDQRSQQIQSEADYFAQSLVLAVRNRGRQDLVHLPLVMEWLDASGKLFYRLDKPIEFPEGLPLAPGESQAIRIEEKIPFKLDRFALYRIRYEPE